MIIAAVLAGGHGSRFGSELPKQFLALAGTPVIIHTVRAFCGCPEVDEVWVAVPEEHMELTRKELDSFGLGRVKLAAGGCDRNRTLLNVLDAVGDAEPDSVILTHDAVRPFVSRRMIIENIEAAREYGACNTVVPAVDTALISADGLTADSVPPRSTVFNVQTPQSFRLDRLRALYAGMSAEELGLYTDACTVFVNRGETVRLVRGSEDNIKITYPGDLPRAELIYKKTQEESQ